MQVTVFSVEHCVQCNATYRKLDKIIGKDNYVVINARTEPGAAELVASLGETKMPMVLVHEGDWRDFRLTPENEGQRWYGYREGKIEAIPEMLDALVAA